jgi:uncharacterized protein YegL
MGDKEKTPKEMARHIVNKTTGKAIAKRLIAIKQHEAAIKKLNKEISKLESGEMVPDADEDDESSSSYTYVNFLLDTSGSMAAKKQETINSFNEYIQSLKKDKKSKYKFSLTKFHSQANVIYNNMDMQNVPELTDKTYQPDGMTALFDAIGITASKISKDEKNKILFIILTDGEENSSNEYKIEAIKKLIDEKQKKNWTFTFMGCDIDAYNIAKTYGISRGNTISFNNERMCQSMQFAAASTRSLAAGGQSATKGFFTRTKGSWLSNIKGKTR